MFKLVKYEFRKARTALLILCGITAVLQAAFQYGLWANDETAIIVSVILLALCAFGVSVFVLVRGITTYTSELKTRAGYLTFLTPNSALKIVGSKFLYTFLNALLAFVVFALLVFLDVSQLMVYFGEYVSMADLVADIAASFGIHVREILLYGLFYVLYAFLSLLSFVAVAYFATTLSATLFRDKKWSWVVSLALFVAISIGINNLEGLFLVSLNSVQLIAPNSPASMTLTPAEVWQGILVPALWSSSLISLGVIAASLFSCSFMLEKKVSL